MLVYLPTKEEDVSLNKVDLLLKSYNNTQILSQLTHRLNKHFKQASLIKTTIQDVGLNTFN